MPEGNPQGSGPSNRPNMPEDEPPTSQKVFKKSSSNNKITLYVACRHLVLEADRVHRVEGVLLIDPEYAGNRNIYGQIIVIFRYGREDEEIMGLQFFNETIVNMVRIWPTGPFAQRANVPLTSPLQETLVRRLGPNAIPFHIELFNTAPPSVVLVPTKPYRGQPVGTSYDVRVFMDEEPGDMVPRPIILRMGISVTHSASRIDSAPLLTPSPSNESFRLKPRYQKLKYVYCESELDFEGGQLSLKTPMNLSPRMSPIKSRLKDLKARTKTRAPPDNANVNGENTDSGDQDTNQRNGLDDIREERSDFERSENGGESIREGHRSDNVEEIQENEEISVETESAVPVGPRPPPRVKVEKSFLLSDGKVYLESWLDKSSYHHGDKVIVNFRIKNNSKKKVQRIKAYAIQHVDVCMFDNGKFKNVVAMAKDRRYSVPAGQRFTDYYTLRPRRLVSKNWIALESSMTNPECCLASTVVVQPEDAKRRGISSIFISYYVKLTLLINRFGGELTVKLPFSLSHAPINESPPDSTSEESGNRTYLEEGGCIAGDTDDNGRKNNDTDTQTQSQKDVGENNHNKEDVNDGTAPISNQGSSSEGNPEGSQSVSDEISENVIENEQGHGTQIEEVALVHVGKPDEEEKKPVGRYLETNI